MSWDINVQSWLVCNYSCLYNLPKSGVYMSLKCYGHHIHIMFNKSFICFKYPELSKGYQISFFKNHFCEFKLHTCREPADFGGILGKVWVRPANFKHWYLSSYLSYRNVSIHFIKVFAISFICHTPRVSWIYHSWAIEGFMKLAKLTFHPLC